MTNSDAALPGGSGGPADPPAGGPPRVFLVVVDDSQEWRTALRFACRRAVLLRARIALLRVIEPDEYDNWMNVGAVMREEQREEAERLLQRIARSVNELAHSMPVLIVREGVGREEVARLIEEMPSICGLVLGASAGADGPGPLIQHFTGKRAGRLRVPVTIVPGGLTDAEVDSLTAVAGA